MGRDEPLVTKSGVIVTDEIAERLADEAEAGYHTDPRQEGPGPGAVIAPRPFFTPKGLAAYLAVSERKVRQMLADREIASYRVAGQRRIAPTDVDEYLAARRDERR